MKPTPSLPPLDADADAPVEAHAAARATRRWQRLIAWPLFWPMCTLVLLLAVYVDVRGRSSRGDD